MKASLRLLVSLGVGVLLVGAVSVYRGRSAATPRDEPAPEWETDEARRADELAVRQHLVLWRTAEQQRVSRELAAGRCTLLEAASQYRALYRGDPILVQALRHGYPGTTDEERVCRWVITYTRVALEDQPGAAGLGARLEAELQGHLERGPLRLTE
jgi:hypothetical protein